MFGPFAYNIFTNDLVLNNQNLCSIYNYADDNTIMCSSKNICDVINNLEYVSNVMLDWFKANYMQANPEKKSVNYVW